MEKTLQGHFFNPTRGNLTAEKVMEEMINYMLEKPEKFYDIIVGCDSSSGNEPHFPVAVAILRVGEGGRFFLTLIKDLLIGEIAFYKRFYYLVILLCF